MVVNSKKSRLNSLMLSASKRREVVSRSDVLRERINNGRRSNTERARIEDCLCLGDGEMVSILRAESARWQISILC